MSGSFDALHSRCYISCTKYSSTIRQVPDHQEVYLDKDGFTSIIFDITERVGGPGSSPEIDGRALTTHLEDIVDSDDDTVKVWNTANTVFSKLSYVPHIVVGQITNHMFQLVDFASS
jgi:hypothetical protein